MLGAVMVSLDDSEGVREKLEARLKKVNKGGMPISFDWAVLVLCRVFAQAKYGKKATMRAIDRSGRCDAQSLDRPRECVMCHAVGGDDVKKETFGGAISTHRQAAIFYAVQLDDRVFFDAGRLSTDHKSDTVQIDSGEPVAWPKFPVKWNPNGAAVGNPEWWASQPLRLSVRLILSK